MFYTVYKITNILNSMIYIGVHYTNNLNDGYMGSGTKIINAIKSVGINNFKKEILYIFDNKDEMLRKEAELVTKEFVTRLDTYNISLGGIEALYAKDRVVVKDIAGNIFTVFKNDERYLSGQYVHIQTNKVMVKDKLGKVYNISKNDERWLSGKLISIHKNMCPVKDKDNNIFYIDTRADGYLSGQYVHVTKERVSVKDKDGNTSSVSVFDKRYLSSELVGVSKNLVTVKDNIGRTLTISKFDTRYLSGELKHTSHGTVTVRDKNGKCTKVSIHDKRYLSGELQHNIKGSKWMNNGIKSRLVSSLKINHYVEEGWVYGRIKRLLSKQIKVIL